MQHLRAHVGAAGEHRTEVSRSLWMLLTRINTNLGDDCTASWVGGYISIFLSPPLRWVCQVSPNSQPEMTCRVF